jgi:hypothetical protein
MVEIDVKVTVRAVVVPEVLLDLLMWLLLNRLKSNWYVTIYRNGARYITI